MRILVCGGRDFKDEIRLNNELAKLISSRGHSEYLFNGQIDVRNVVIIQGGAKGADKLAKEFADFYGIPNKEYKADWDRYDKAAGPIRNQQMLEQGEPDVVLAFPTENSRGTWDMVRRARKAGIETRVYE